MKKRIKDRENYPTKDVEPENFISDKKVNKLINNLGYSGLMSAEFKKDENDGLLKFLEINARVWWHMWLSERCGVDILFASYLDAIGEKYEYLEKYETGIVSLYLLNYISVLLNNFMNNKLNTKEEINYLLNPIEYSILSKDDISPFVVDCINRVKKFIGVGN